MKKTSIVLILVGVALVIASFFMAEIVGSNMFESIQTSSQSNYERQEKTFNANEITKVNVDSSNDQIQVIPIDSQDQIIVEYYDSDNVEFYVDIEDGELKINKHNKNGWNWFSFGFLEPKSVIVRVPNNSKYNYILETSNGSIDVLNTEVETINIETSNGSIKLDHVSSNGDIYLKTSNASISLADIAALYVKANTSNGSIDLKNVDSAKTEVNTSNGHITFDSLHSNDIDMKSSNGRIDGSIIGKLSDYRSKVSTSNGQIVIDNIEYGKLVRSDTGEKRLEIDTSNASINIDFID